MFSLYQQLISVFKGQKMPVNNLPKSLQEAFDIVWDRSKLLKKTQYLIDGGPGAGTALINGYRGNYKESYGESCFIGELIPDSLYSAKLENYSISNIIDDYEEFKSLNPIKTQLQELQEIHDVEPVSSWKDKLINFAKTHGLGIPQ